MKEQTYQEIEIEGNQCLLLPEKALLWVNEGGLIISDVHLGKAGHFRKNGIALPQTSNDENLRVIDTLIEKWNPKWILFLGDLFHSEKNDEWNSFKVWVKSHSTIKFYLVMGNHELYPESEYKLMGIECMNLLDASPFLFVHDEIDAADIENRFVISGHVHPSIRLKGKGRQSLRIPCFYFEERKAILPAFGTLTGTHNVKALKKSKIYGVLDNQILQII